MSNHKTTQFNCFSPPVMVATLIIETVLAMYTVWRYNMTVVTRLITASLVALGTFQLAEYFVCTGYGFQAEQWSRLGFAAITTLPPLGIHMMHRLADKPARKLVAASYVAMAGFITYFMTYSTAFIGHQCTGNYVIFQIGYKAGGVYGFYYYGLLLTGIVLGIRWSNALVEQGKALRTRLEMVRALIIGYLVFLVPTAISNTVAPSTRAGIPSVMCGFAVIFALILALYILPRAATEKESSELLAKLHIRR